MVQSAHYLPHDAGVDGLDADVLTVQVKTVHEALCGPDELVALARPGDQAQLPLQIHGEVGDGGSGRLVHNWVLSSYYHCSPLLISD